MLSVDAGKTDQVVLLIPALTFDDVNCSVFLPLLANESASLVKSERSRLATHVEYKQSHAGPGPAVIF